MPDKNLILALTLWTTQQLGVDISEVPPLTVQYLDPKVVEEIGANQSTVLATGNQAVLYALYQDGVMYLRSDMDWNLALTQSTFVHEFVHHLQWAFPEIVEDNRLCALEAQAYEIEARFLDTLNIDLMENDGSRPSLQMPQELLERETSCDALLPAPVRHGEQ